MRFLRSSWRPWSDYEMGKREGTGLLYHGSLALGCHEGLQFTLVCVQMTLLIVYRRNWMEMLESVSRKMEEAKASLFAITLAEDSTKSASQEDAWNREYERTRQQGRKGAATMFILQTGMKRNRK